MGYTITETIRRFLTDRAWLTAEHDLTEHDSLLEKGVIDSMAMVELITFIEETYRIRVQDADLMPENFDSLTSITAYIQSKQASGE